MGWFKADDRRLAEIISKLSYCNPFLQERIEYEKAALGSAFESENAIWNVKPYDLPEHPNVTHLRKLVEAKVEQLQGRFKPELDVSEDELHLYHDLVVFILYHRYREGFDRTILKGQARGESQPEGRPGRMKLFEPFSRDLNAFYEHIPNPMNPGEQAHLFACFYQVRRAFYHIYEHLLGTSNPMIELRARIWQSIFTHDMRRYLRVLYRHMGDITTLISGPSGTGKELVARAVGLSRYIPFNPDKQQFEEELKQTFFPLNLSALSPTLIESELFGHCKGAYTGAVGHREGWLEICPASGTVFLDEIGELDPAIQVKLLRVLQTRNFSRLGETTERRFCGKIITATNRDMAERVSAGFIREDFYYRLCSDTITMPSLAERLRENPEELTMMVLHMTRRMIEEEAESLSKEVEVWIIENLGMDYAWPGNVRELEQCVRNYLIRKHYEPPRIESDVPNPQKALVDALSKTRMSAESLMQLYCTLRYEELENYEHVAEELEIDRRTVKSKINQTLLEQMRS